MIPLSRVKIVCTAAEVELVQASRTPEIDRLSAARIKQLSIQARKSIDKWQDLARKQLRDRSHATGLGVGYERTQEKAAIFRDVLDQFNRQLDRLTSTPAVASVGKKLARTKVRKTKPTTTATPAGKQKLVGKSRVPAIAKAGKPKRSALVSAAVGQPQLAPGLVKNLKTSTAAKQDRLEKSGQTTRMLGHALTRGKRQQARRDAASKGLGRGMQKRSS